MYFRLVLLKGATPLEETQRDSLQTKSLFSLRGFGKVSPRLGVSEKKVTSLVLFNLCQEPSFEARRSSSPVCDGGKRGRCLEGFSFLLFCLDVTYLFYEGGGLSLSNV